MKIFLDFDDVVFNTKDFTEHLKKVFQEYGVSDEVFQETYQSLKKDFPSSSPGYRPDIHIEKIKVSERIDEIKLQEAVKQVLADTQAFVFPDVETFLLTAKELGYSINILSFGDKEFQTQKISGTQLDQYFDKVIVTDQEKGQAMLTEGDVTDEETWFFDDRVHFLESAKKQFPSIRTVLVSRPEGRYTDPQNDFSDYQISHLGEGQVLLRGTGG
jgi:FMN phosphatase YigB (HAD superfamily)